MTWMQQEFPDPILYRILERLRDEPETVKGVFLHLLCRRMQERGLLELRGVGNAPGSGRSLLYKDPKSGSIYEINDPQLSPGEELIATEDLNALLEEELRRN